MKIQSHKLGRSLSGMKYIAAVVLFFAFSITLLMLNTSVCLAETPTGNPVYSTTESVNYGKGTAKFTVVRVNLNDPKIQIVAATPGDKIGTTANLSELVAGETNEDGTGVAGINGTFFNAYTDFQPAGTVIKDGEVQQISNAGSVFGIDGDNKVHLDAMYTTIVGSTLEQTNWPYGWEAWNVNHWYPDQKATMLFNKAYAGPKPVHNFTAIELNNGLVTKISVGGFAIANDGFTILTNDTNVIQKFVVGQKAGYSFSFLANAYGTKKVSELENLPWASMKTAIGAGPTLVKNGVIVVDPVKEKFTEPKILTNKGQRSFVGVTAANQLVFGSVSSVSVSELAVIAQKLGLIQAMNLDGGGSSTVWMAKMNALQQNGKPASGSYIAPPGRKISNALVVRYMKEKPVKVTLNKEELFFDAEPYVNKEYSRILVPLRKIAESLGARVTWDGATNAIVVTKGSTVLKMQTNNRQVTINGVASMLELPVITRYGRAYVPARFLGELLGATVGWDGPGNTVTLKIATNDAFIAEGEVLERKKLYTEAAVAYEKAIAVDTNNVMVLKRLASIYHYKMAQYDDAIRVHQRIIFLEPGNVLLINAYAWSLYMKTDYPAATQILNSIIDMGKANASTYYLMGHISRTWIVNNTDAAKSWYNKALQSNPTEGERDYMTKWLSEN